MDWIKVQNELTSASGWKLLPSDSWWPGRKMQKSLHEGLVQGSAIRSDTALFYILGAELSVLSELCWEEVGMETSETR